MRSLTLWRRPTGPWLGLCALTLLALALPTLIPSPAPASDAVVALRDYLRSQGRQLDAAQLKEREKQLKQLIASLKSISELREALSLPYWQDLGARALVPGDVDRAARAEVGRRLEKALTEAARSGSVTRRLAVAHAIGAMGNDIRTLNPPENVKGRAFVRPQRSFASSLAPVLIGLCQDREPSVRQAAARALGRINPEPPAATAALKALFEKGDAGTRRAAAEALCSLVELPTPYTVEPTSPGFGRTTFGKKAAKKAGDGWGMRSIVMMRGRLTMRDVVDAARDVVGSAAVGMGDPDPQVRGLCLEALRRTAVALHQEIASNYSLYLPAGDRALTPLQQRRLGMAANTRQEHLRPLLGAWYEYGASLRRALRSPDAAANQKSAEIVQTLAEARAQLQPARSGEKIPEDPLGKVVLFAVPDLAGKLTHENTGVRLACLGALEALGLDAAPATEALVQALKDREVKVRMGAVRALARVGPEPLSEALAAKVACGLAGCAEDENPAVRLGALVALPRYRSAAEAVTPPLLRALPKADALTQRLIIEALEGIGAKAKAAVPVLTAALSAAEPLVRAAAARALGRFGRAAAPATKALVAALDDTNVAVQQAASEALLVIGDDGP
jgi:HEAT repeat protein